MLRRPPVSSFVALPSVSGGGVRTKNRPNSFYIKWRGVDVLGRDGMRVLKRLAAVNRTCRATLTRRSGFRNEGGFAEADAIVPMGKRPPKPLSWSEAPDFKRKPSRISGGDSWALVPGYPTVLDGLGRSSIAREGRAGVKARLFD